MGRPRKPDAQRARELSAKGLTPPEISAKLDVPRQNVHAALKRNPKLGRPRLPTVRRSIRLPLEVDERVQANARTTGHTVEQVIVNAVRKGFGLKP